MKKKRSGSGVSRALLAAVAVLFAALCLYMPKTVSEATEAALSLCASRVIPSVFPFAVLSSFFVASGGAEITDRLAAPLGRRLFGSEHGVSALLQGLFFGFPLGALTIGEQFRAGGITKNEAARLLAFVSCASPTFPVFVVGIGYFGSLTAGLTLWGTQAAVSVLIGIITSFPRKKAASPSRLTERQPAPGGMAAFTSSVTGGARVMLNVCGAVTFFSIVSAISARLFSNVTASPFPALLTSAAFEFSTGTSAAHAAFVSGEISRRTALALCGFSIGSAGLSVLFQTASVTDGISLLPHMAGKLVTGAVTAAVMYATAPLPAFAPVSSPVFAPTREAVAAFDHTVFAAAALFLAVHLTLRKKGVAKTRRALYNISVKNKRGHGGTDERK